MLLLRAEATRVMAATRSAFAGTVKINNIDMEIYKGVILKYISR